MIKIIYRHCGVRVLTFAYIWSMIDGFGCFVYLCVGSCNGPAQEHTHITRLMSMLITISITMAGVILLLPKLINSNKYDKQPHQPPNVFCYTEKWITNEWNTPQNWEINTNRRIFAHNKKENVIGYFCFAVFSLTISQCQNESTYVRTYYM